MWRNRATVGQELAGVVEEDDDIAQQAPPLLGVEGDDAGRITVGAVSWRAGGLVCTHCLPLGIAEVFGLRGPWLSGTRVILATGSTRAVRAGFSQPQP